MQTFTISAVQLHLKEQKYLQKNIEKSIGLVKKGPLGGVGGLSLFLMLLFSANLAAQTNIQWDKTFGGDQGEFFQSIEPTSDGGYIIGGVSQSGISGNRTAASKGSADYWIVKIAADGTKMWDKAYGGSDWDALNSVKQTADGGYILGGHSYSPAGFDKTDDNHNSAETDYWIVKISSDGTKEWDRSIGSEFFEELREVQQTTDGGYLLGGSSSSSRPGGDKTDAHYGGDFWVVKLAADGTKLWDRSYGGRDAETLQTITPTVDGGFIFGGSSVSDASWDKTEDSKGGSDYWVMKTDANGIKQWDKTIGGNGSDWLNSVEQTADGGYILGGTSSSGISGDKSEGKRGINDYWVVKLNAAGTVEWDKTIGGTTFINADAEIQGESSLYSVRQLAEGGYILAGDSNAAVNDDKTQASKGDKDVWLVKISSTGAIVWDMSIGGENLDYFPRLINTEDGGFVLGVQSESGATGDKTGPAWGNRDFWIVKLTADINLPVSLTNFSVYAENTSALLSWQTTMETNSDRFEVQHSTNGKSWSLLGTVSAKGKSNELRSYQYMHTSPASGENLYRLKIFDNDGTFAYSKINSLRFDENLLVNVFPNPTAEILTLKVADWSKVTYVEIINGQGNSVYHSGAIPLQSISVKGLPKGLYFLRIILSDGSSVTRKIAIGN
ncbi:T9SS type A sorting domain-containing protein [Dyadobacter sandarakinus]|uniref:T9SS type A sorting domain-containing protein n=1 Tax=Dyadobacter sandarakinus TaxID=2747268 RepID=A0ABX7I8P1_9BACT|nr:T9SS type A sorting domain-containing protein [Dyadobacter sandarakinus]QRR02471.1 T9SS type A sorting domain-containing protein [Dyadobacter sandarakinus]